MKDIGITKIILCFFILNYIFSVKYITIFSSNFQTVLLKSRKNPVNYYFWLRCHLKVIYLHSWTETMVLVVYNLGLVAGSIISDLLL